MARPLISIRTVATIGILRDRGWETSFATSDPQVSLILVREPDPDIPGDTGILAAQNVVVEWPDSKSIEATMQGGGSVEALTWVIFRRPMSYGFDVTVGNTFTMAEHFGEIQKVWEEMGMKKALATVDVGTP